MCKFVACFLKIDKYVSDSSYIKKDRTNRKEVF